MSVALPRGRVSDNIIVIHTKRNFMLGGKCVMAYIYVCAALLIQEMVKYGQYDGVYIANFVVDCLNPRIWG